MYGLGRALVILIVVAALGVGAWRYAIGWRPSPKNFPMQGVDVSEANGAIEWPTVAAGGATFAYAVATRGANARDRTFEANWRGIDAAEMSRGAVHVFSLCVLASDQADAFNTVVPADPHALPSAIDIAYDPDCTARPDRDVLVGEIARAATMIEAHMGKPVLLRISRAVETDYRLSAALPRPVWAVGNVFPPAYAARPWRMWRASDFRRVDGIDGPVNWNVVKP